MEIQSPTGQLHPSVFISTSQINSLFSQAHPQIGPHGLDNIRMSDLDRPCFTCIDHHLYVLVYYTQKAQAEYDTLYFEWFLKHFLQPFALKFVTIHYFVCKVYCLLTFIYSVKRLSFNFTQCH